MGEERLKGYLCALNPKSDFHLLMLGALYRLQQRTLSSKPVLSTSHRKNITELIAGQWLSQVWAWAARSKISIETDACSAGPPAMARWHMNARTNGGLAGAYGRVGPAGRANASSI
jgi:hypothetical protein